MHIRKKSNREQQCGLRNAVLQLAEEEKDMRVIVDSNLSFYKHISEKVNKGNSMFALLKRTFRYMECKTFVPLYKTLVRIHLDFASSVWAPFKPPVLLSLGSLILYIKVKI
jgi:hypothetical protein